MVSDLLELITGSFADSWKSCCRRKRRGSISQGSMDGEPAIRLDGGALIMDNVRMDDGAENIITSDYDLEK